MHAVEKLKTVRRKIRISDNSRQESPAEHSWRAALMAVLLYEQQDLQIDILKVLKLILIHDIVEAEADDVWILDANDEAAFATKAEKEEVAAKHLFYLLPDPLNQEYYDLWHEFEDQKTQEARFARALDKVEVIIQRTDLGYNNWERQDVYELLQHWADEAVANFPPIQELWDLTVETMRKQAGDK